MKHKLLKSCTVVVLAALLLALPPAGFAASKKSGKSSGAAEKVQAPVRETNPNAGRAKYVFLFIGDGMGLPQVSATEIYCGAKVYKEPGVVSLNFTRFPAQGITTTHDASSFITDSASAATAIATGNKTLNGVINMDVTKSRKFTTIAETAKANGMKVGIVSSVSIDHATPACFYAHQPSRKNYYEIGLELAASGFEYFGGGGFLEPTGPKKDKPNLLEVAKEKGYSMVESRDEFMALAPGGKVLAVSTVLADESALNYELDRSGDELSLAEFTRKGIELLENPKGFFMMVEGGKIDWACHANDAKSAIKDVIAFADAIEEAVIFEKKHHGETLIVVTGDHECGGMTIGFAGTQYSTFFTKLDGQTISYVKFSEMFRKLVADKAVRSFDDIMPLITEHFGLVEDEKAELGLTVYEKQLLKDAFAVSMLDSKARPKDDGTYIAYGTYDPLTVTVTHILNRKSGIGWTSYSHTGIPVPTYAMGVRQELFDGYYDNTDIFKKMVEAIGL